MAYFPVLNSFEQILPAIEGAEEFIIKRAEQSGILIVNYLFAAATTFPNPLEAESPEKAQLAAIRRECRGLKFDIDTGEVVTRPYHKFFNVNEKAETQAGLIDWSRPHMILEKLDGSMINPWRTKDGRREWHTRLGATQVSESISGFVHRANDIDYLRFCDAIREMGATPTFEWCSRTQRIVLDYPQDRLVLTAIRDNVTGAYTHYNDMVRLAAPYRVPVVYALPGSVENVQQFMSEIYGAKGIEGVVIRFDEDAFKIKGEWYCQIHGTKDTLARERNIWELIVEDRLDDLKPFMDPVDRANVEAFANDFDLALERYGHKLVERVEQLRSRCDSKRAFAEAVSTVAPVRDQGLMFSIYDGRTPVEAILRLLRKNIGSLPRLEGVRDIVGGLTWANYYRGEAPED